MILYSFICMLRALYGYVYAYTHISIYKIIYVDVCGCMHVHVCGQRFIHILSDYIHLFILYFILTDDDYISITARFMRC